MEFLFYHYHELLSFSVYDRWMDTHIYLTSLKEKKIHWQFFTPLFLLKTFIHVALSYFSQRYCLGGGYFSTVFQLLQFFKSPKVLSLELELRTAICM